MQKLLNASIEQLSRFGLFTCLHLALLGTKLEICHQQCIEQIVRRFSDNVTSLRAKDFERITLVIGLFDFESESKIESRLCANILNQLNTQQDRNNDFPRCFSLCLSYLAMKGYHDERLISEALSEPYLQQAYGKPANHSLELFVLDSYAKINLKNSYKGNALTAESLQCRGRNLKKLVPSRRGKLTHTDSLLLELKEALDGAGFSHCYFGYALPHFDRPGKLNA